MKFRRSRTETKDQANDAIPEIDEMHSVNLRGTCRKCTLRCATTRAQVRVSATEGRGDERQISVSTRWRVNYETTKIRRYRRSRGRRAERNFAEEVVRTGGMSPDVCSPIAEHAPTARRKRDESSGMLIESH